MGLSIIIVNYNGEKYLENCIGSIQQTLSFNDYEIIIVDNASTDGSLVLLKKKFPFVKVLEQDVNLGFGKANNRGVKEAKYSNILLLNNDTILHDDISTLINQLEEDSSMGGITIKMVDGKGNYLINTGSFPKPLSLLRISNLKPKNKELISGKFISKRIETDWISGAFFLTRKNVWESVNGFDEDFFMYVEDVDMCKRIKDKGFKFYFYPDYSFTHFVGFSFNREIQLLKGYLLYSKKHFKGLGQILALVLIYINITYKKLKLMFLKNK